MYSENVRCITSCCLLAYMYQTEISNHILFRINLSNLSGIVVSMTTVGINHVLVSKRLPNFKAHEIGSLVSRSTRYRNFAISDVSLNATEWPMRHDDSRYHRCCVSSVTIIAIVTWLRMRYVEVTSSLSKTSLRRRNPLVPCAFSHAARSIGPDTERRMDEVSQKESRKDAVRE